MSLICGMVSASERCATSSEALVCDVSVTCGVVLLWVCVRAVEWKKASDENKKCWFTLHNKAFCIITMQKYIFISQCQGVRVLCACACMCAFSHSSASVWKNVCASVWVCPVFPFLPLFACHLAQYLSDSSLSIILCSCGSLSFSLLQSHQYALGLKYLSAHETSSDKTRETE